MRKAPRVIGRRSITIAVATLLVTATASLPAVAAPAKVTLENQLPLSLSMLSGSVDYLKTKYGVSDAEALRRLELQRTHDKIHRQLESKFASNYSGSWIDQDRGGILVIHSKNPARLVAALREAPDFEHMRFGTSARSYSELQAAAKRIAKRLGLPSWLEPDIDPVNNRLVITEMAAAKIRPAGPAALGPDSALIRIVAAPNATVPACTIQNCTPPMRGGAKLYIFPSLSSPTWVGWCTNGFNVKSAPLNWQWTLTAGHCVESANAKYTDHNAHWVGQYQANTFTGGDLNYPLDGAIMPYVVTGGVNYADYWFAGQPRNRVWATNVGDPLYPIKGSYSYDQIGIGWVACHTGATSQNTRCGQVVAKDGGVVMDICAQRGDSGGPLFSQVDQYAYAILSRINNLNGGCPTGVRSLYSPVSKIFAKAQAQSGQTFSVNTN